jgi:hypothetical protein
VPEPQLAAADLDSTSLSALLDDADPIGVLSIFVDARAEARGTAIDIHNRLSQLERSVAAEGPPERATALSGTLARLEREIERLCDPSASGRGRAMFAPLSRDVPIRLSTQLRLPNRVVLDDRPFVHPLLESLEQGRPAGVVLISRDIGEVLEWRHGEMVTLARITREAAALRERSGPMATRAARHPQTTPLRERRQRGSRDQVRRFVDRVADEVTEHATRRGWERAVVSGDDRLTGPLVRALPDPLRENAIRDPRRLIEREARSLIAIVQLLLERQQAEWDLRLTKRILDAAMAAGGAALGLSEVLAALNDARVMHLVYDPEVRFAGAIAEDGQLSLPPEQRTMAAGTIEEPRMTERMVERCLETGARITPVSGEAAAMLSDLGGVAARLRW